MLKFMQETLSVWELLQHTKKPIVLYGMGKAPHGEKARMALRNGQRSR